MSESVQLTAEVFICLLYTSVTALLTPVLLVFLLLLCLIFRKKRGLFCILPLVLMLAGLAVNAMAPGNATRMAAQLDSMGPVEAVYYSFLYAFKGIRDWTTVYLIFFTVLLLPFLCVGLSRCDFDFPLPGVVAGLSYCVVAASYTPVSYTHLDVYKRQLQLSPFFHLGYPPAAGTIGGFYDNWKF